MVITPPIEGLSQRSFDGWLLGIRSNVSRVREVKEGVLENSQSSACLSILGHREYHDYQESGGFETKGVH